MLAKVRHQNIECDPGCSVEATLSLIEGKWKCVILFQLAKQTLRFGELRQKIPRITQRMLTNQLRELETDDLISRVIYAQIPPKVEYSMSARGRSLLPILAILKTWGDENAEAFAYRLQSGHA